MLGGASGSVRSLAETHGLVTRAGTRVWASSDALGWRSVFASTQREAPFEGLFQPVADHLVVVHLSGPVRVCRTLDGRQETRLIPPGGAFIMPGGVSFGVRLEAELDTIHFYLSRAVVEEMAAEFAGGGEVPRIVPGLGTLDPLLEQIAIALRDQLCEGSAATALYVDHLARAAAARLIRSHSTAGAVRTPVSRSRGLSQRQLRRAVEYIEAHLGDDPSLAQLAAATALSPIYFARQFKLATGLPPHQYLLQQRLERAKRLLSADELPISAIAIDCGFCHQEHFTRLFRRYCGTTPAAYRAALRH